MDESIFLLNEQDNVGDVLGKINYNFLKHNSDLMDLETNSVQNLSYVNKIDSLMDKMDYLISLTDFDKFQDFDTTVNMLSSYWNSLEFTVQYPFNPISGFTSALVTVAGGELLGSTNVSTHENILTNALLAKKLPYIQTKEDAKSNLYNNGVIVVNRSDYGDFISWDFVSIKNILSILVDSSNDFYYNGRLVDVYNIPYYSVITTVGVDIYKNLTPDYDSKIVISDSNIPLLPNKTSLTGNVLIEYDRVIFENYDMGDGKFAPITQFIPKITKLNNIIQDNNNTFASKIQNSNAESLGVFSENNKIHNIALSFLNEKYPARDYPENTISNVVFMLYNSVGSNTGQVAVETLCWDEDTLSIPKKINEVLKKSNIDKTAPGSNTTYNMTYTKENIYIEKIVNVKYKKNIVQKDIVTVISGVHKIITVQESSWDYLGINIGRSYTPNLFLDEENFKPAVIRGDISPEYTG